MAKPKNSTAKKITATTALLAASQTPPDASTKQESTAATETGATGNDASASTAAAETGATGNEEGASTAATQTAKAAESPAPETKAKPDPAKDEKPKTGEMTPVQKAAKFVGIPVDQVFDFSEKEDGRFVVVTVSGHKFNNTPAEREAAAKQAADEARARAARKAAKAAR